MQMADIKYISLCLLKHRAIIWLPVAYSRTTDSVPEPFENVRKSFVSISLTIYKERLLMDKSQSFCVSFVYVFD